jgi:hypothetical protein
VAAAAAVQVGGQGVHATVAIGTVLGRKRFNREVRSLKARLIYICEKSCPIADWEIKEILLR